MKDFFRKFAAAVANAVGHPLAFIGALLIVIVWATTGPVFHYSDTWQLVINTGTTIVTFLIVFLIQNAQNRDSKAIHLKLNELLKAVHGARTELVDLEEMSDEDLESLHAEFKKIHDELHAHVERRGLDPKKPKQSRNPKKKPAD
ncbi:MAG: low affinity iron permease family protein [Bdellovibrionales bacterium]|nr:low affinity iron permease family protein [Bdellovibrionales bacterium]